MKLQKDEVEQEIHFCCCCCSLLFLQIQWKRIFISYMYGSVLYIYSYIFFCMHTPHVNNEQRKKIDFVFITQVINSMFQYFASFHSTMWLFCFSFWIFSSNTREYVMNDDDVIRETNSIEPPRNTIHLCILLAVVMTIVIKRKKHKRVVSNFKLQLIFNFQYPLVILYRQTSKWGSRD